MNTDQLAEDILCDVQSAARKVAREWADVITAEDAEQEIWLRILSSSNDYLSKIVELEKAARVAVLAQIGHQVGLKYRDDYELFSGNHRYGTYQVRELLDSGVLAGRVDEAIPLWEMPESVVRQIERTDNETLTEMMDLFGGLKALYRRNPRYAEIIESEYGANPSIEPLDNADRVRLTRAVDALTSAMNNAHRRSFAEYSEGPGSRKATSNEKSRAISQRQYSGDSNAYNSFAQ